MTGARRGRCGRDPTTVPRCNARDGRRATIPKPKPQPPTLAPNPLSLILGATMRREFHFKEGSSNKFWSIELDGKKFYVHFGKEGTSGQKQEKAFANADSAQQAHDRLIAEKVKKGYVEKGGGKKTNGTTKLSAVKGDAKTAKAEEAAAPAAALAVKTD